MATEKQKMLAGELYVATGEELAADARRVAAWMDRYNASIARTQREYKTLLREMLAEVEKARTSARRSTATTATTSAWANASSSTSTASSSMS